MNPMRKLILVLSLFAAAAHAGDKDKVYRYTDAKGVIHYTDKPPAKDSKPVDLPPLQTFPSTGKANLSSPTPPVKKLQEYVLAFTAPAADSTFRDAEGIPMTVSVTPPMPQGYGMRFSADGAPLHEDVLQDTSFSANGLERGTHTLTATLVNQDGKEVGSTSVTVFVRPPVAKPQAK